MDTFGDVVTGLRRQQHGFRTAETIVRAIEGELWFYGKVLGFEPADDIEAVAAENLA